MNKISKDKILTNLSDTMELLTLMDYKHSNKIVEVMEYINAQPNIPTEADVCKALSEWLYNSKWEFMENMQRSGFVCHLGEIAREKYIGYDKRTKGVYISNKLNVPPHLITMLGLFYDNKQKELMKSE